MKKKRKALPEKPPSRWTIEDVIEMGVSALGDWMDKLRKKRRPSSKDALILGHLTKAAVAVSAEQRATAEMKRLKDMKDEELDRMISRHYGVSLDLFQSTLAKLREQQAS